MNCASTVVSDPTLQRKQPISSCNEAGLVASSAQFISDVIKSLLWEGKKVTVFICLGEGMCSMVEALVSSLWEGHTQNIHVTGFGPLHLSLRQVM